MREKKALQTIPKFNNKNRQRDFLCHTQLQHKTRNPTPKSKKTTGNATKESKGQSAECDAETEGQQTTSRTKRTVNNKSKKTKATEVNYFFNYHT
jgi:hypothetical protein